MVPATVILPDHPSWFASAERYKDAVIRRDLDAVTTKIKERIGEDNSWHSILRELINAYDSITRYLCLTEHRELFLHLLNDEAVVLNLLITSREPTGIEEINESGETPLMIVSGPRGNFRCFEILLKRKPNVNAQDPEGSTPLRLLFKQHWPDQWWKLLLDQPGVDVNLTTKTEGSPLHFVCKFGETRQAEALFEYRADANLYCPAMIDGTPLLVTLLSGQTYYKVNRIVSILINGGADVQMITKDTFYNPLSAACFGTEARQERIESTIDILLGSGASAEARDPITRRLPIHFAAMSGIKNLERILESYTGDIMEPDIHGRNCLHWAAQFGNAKALAHILSIIDGAQEEGEQEAKERIRQCLARTDVNGWTPLCWAVRPAISSLCPWGRNESESTDFEATVKLLIDNGADISVKCHLGEESVTPLDLARRHGMGQEIIELLSPRSLGLSVSDIIRLPKYIYREHEKSLPCRNCISDIPGRVYTCKSCHEYFVCSKCLVLVDTFHWPEIMGDGKLHTFELCPEYEEYR